MKKTLKETEMRIAKIVLQECGEDYNITALGTGCESLYYTPKPVSQWAALLVLGAWLENDPGIPIELR